MSQKLDDFSKVLLATSTINYMANSLNGVLSDFITLNDYYDKVNLDASIESKKEMMAFVVKKLNDVIEELGNYLEAEDMVCAIDSRIYEQPLQILLHENDEVDKEEDCNEDFIKMSQLYDQSVTTVIEQKQEIESLKKQLHKLSDFCESIPLPIVKQ